MNSSGNDNEPSPCECHRESPKAVTSKVLILLIQTTSIALRLNFIENLAINDLILTGAE